MNACCLVQVNPCKYLCKELLILDIRVEAVGYVGYQSRALI